MATGVDLGPPVGCVGYFLMLQGSTEDHHRAVVATWVG